MAVLLVSGLHAQETAITSSGHRVILNDDKTWAYLPEVVVVGDVGLQGKKIETYGPCIDISNPIILSVPTNVSATEFRHLSITHKIIVGRTSGETQPDFDLGAQLKNEQFMETAEKFEPFVKDQVNKTIMSYSYLQLQEDKIRDEIAKVIKAKLNSTLQDYGLKPRFSALLFTSYVFSD
jgi:hypothetical protein